MKERRKIRSESEDEARARARPELEQGLGLRGSGAVLPHRSPVFPGPGRGPRATSLAPGRWGADEDWPQETLLAQPDTPGAQSLQTPA
jgi:hypothetical protein